MFNNAAMPTNGEAVKATDVWDAIIIGGGPAGSIAALALARRREARDCSGEGPIPAVSYRRIVFACYI